MAATRTEQGVDSDHFVKGNAIVIKDFVSAQNILYRLERRVRQSFLGQSRPYCAIVKRLGESDTQVNGLRAASLLTPKGSRPLWFRPRTSDEDVIEQIFCSRDYDLTRFSRWPELHDFLEARHREGSVPLIIDAGANIGASAAFFAAMFPTAKVVAIEPEEANFDLLCRNTQGLNVEKIQGALSSEIGHATLVDPGEGNWGFRTRKIAAEEGPPCVTVASLYDGVLGPNLFPFIVKIDIEGAEEDVFRDNTDWVRHTPVVIIELHDEMLPRGGTARPFLRCVGALDRDFVYRGENVFSIDNSIPV